MPNGTDADVAFPLLHGVGSRATTFDFLLKTPPQMRCAMRNTTPLRGDRFLTCSLFGFIFLAPAKKVPKEILLDLGSEKIH